MAEDEYVPVWVSEVGFIDEKGAEGALVLRSKSDHNRVLQIRSLSGETATHVSRFKQGDRSSIPTIYNIVEELAEKNGLHLANVRIYSSNRVLRADLCFEGRQDEPVLRGYRASDAVALAMLYDAPILVRGSLLEYVEPH